jgi:hypothetical protein
MFGGVVRQVTLTTAGALLTGNPADKLRLPSHLAPFLTHIPPNERDHTLFYDKGLLTFNNLKGFEIFQFCFIG